MATKRSVNLKDPTTAGGGQINRMESGLHHCADSLAGGREGTVKIRFGGPGDPLEKSSGVESGFVGKTPNLMEKFTRTKQF
jgi:hypothetical protein